MGYKRILSVQDISCVGQCSLTVALPILSAAGHETAILPSTILSAHTGWENPFIRDLTPDMAGIEAHWNREGITFDAVYTGYLGSAEQIDHVRHIIRTSLRPGGLTFVDPAMGDNGGLYSGFDSAFVREMKRLTEEGDVILPNITEAALLTGLPFRARFDEAYVTELLDALAEGKKKTVILTGVSFREETTGIMIRSEGDTFYYEHERRAKSGPGTGDVFAAAYVGAFMAGMTAEEAAKIAADYTLKCICDTEGDPAHWYAFSG